MRLFLLLFSFFCVSNYAAAEDQSTIEYLAMTPKFTVNLAEPKKYLRVDIQLMVEGDKAIAKVKKNFPALRHALIMFFSGQAAADLQTMEQREKLREAAFKVIQDALSKYTKNSDGVRDLFFTEFLVQ